MAQMNLFTGIIHLIEAWSSTKEVRWPAGTKMAESRTVGESFETFVREEAADHGDGVDPIAKALLTGCELLKLCGSEDTPPEDEATHEYLAEALQVAWAYSVDYSDSEEELRRDHSYQVRLRSLFEIDQVSDEDLKQAVAHANRDQMAEAEAELEAAADEPGKTS